MLSLGGVTAYPEPSGLWLRCFSLTLSSSRRCRCSSCAPPCCPPGPQGASEEPCAPWAISLGLSGANRKPELSSSDASSAQSSDPRSKALLPFFTPRALLAPSELDSAVPSCTSYPASSSITARVPVPVSASVTVTVVTVTDSQDEAISPVPFTCLRICLSVWAPRSPAPSRAPSLSFTTALSTP